MTLSENNPRLFDVGRDFSGLNTSQPTYDVIGLLLEGRRISTEQPEKSKDKGPDANNEKNAGLLKTLSESTDERERYAGETLTRLLSSEEKADRDHAQRLLKMLGDEKEKPLAMSLLTMADGEPRSAYFKLVDDKDTKAVEKINELLESDPWSAQTLLFLLGDKDRAEDSKQLLTMLKNPEQEKLAKSLLQGVALEPDQLHEFFKLMKDPARKDEFAAVLKLLNSDEDYHYYAGTKLLSLLTSTEKNSKDDARFLIRTLKDDPKVAVQMLARVEDPILIHELVIQMKDPANKRATQEIKAMLASGNSHSVVELAELLTNKFEPESKDGQRFLKLLNSENKEERDSASLLLHSVGDLANRHAMLDHIENPALRSGAVKLLEMVSSPRRREQERAYGVVEMLASKQPVEQKAGVGLLKLLSGNDADQKNAGLILNTLHSPMQQYQMIDLLSSEQHKPSAAQLLKWLQEGTPQQQSAANRVLELRGQSVESKEAGPESLGNSFGFPGKPVTDLPKPNPDAEALLKMIGEPKKNADAVAILSTFGNQGEIATMVKLLGDGTRAPQAVALMKMLSSSDYRENNAAKDLVRMLSGRSEDGFASGGAELGGKGRPATAVGIVGDANELLTMLADPEQKANAMRIMSLETDMMRHQTLVLLDRKETKATAERLLKVASTDRTLAGNLLERLGDANLIKKALDLMESKDNPVSASRLKSMLSESSGAYLVKLIGSASESDREFGEELFQNLGSRDYWNLNSLLQAGAAGRLSGKELSYLRDLGNNRETASGARQLESMLQSGDRKTTNAGAQLLRKLANPDEPGRENFQFVFDTLNKVDTRDLAMQTLLVSTTPSELVRLSKAIKNPEERKGAEELLKILNQPADPCNIFAVNPGLSLLAALSSTDAKVAQPAAELLKMLGDERQQGMARNIIETMGRGNRNTMLDFVRILKPSGEQTPEQKEFAKQAAALISGSRGEADGITSLMSLVADGDTRKTGEALRSMLSDAKTQPDAKAILSGLRKPVLIKAFMELLSNDKTKAGANVLLEKLRSKNSEDVESVVAVCEALTNSQGQFDGIEKGFRREDTTQRVIDFVRQLGDEKTADVAKKALALVQNRNGFITMTDLLKTAEGQKRIEDLHKLLAGSKEERSAARIISSLGDSKEIGKILDMLTDDNEKGLAAMLLGMLADTDNGVARFVAQRVLELLIDKSPAVREVGDRMLKMLADGEKRELAERIATNGKLSDITTLTSLVTDEKYKEAADHIVELLKSDDFRDQNVVSSLTSMLSSNDPATKREGQRLLEMLNDRRRAFTAIRLLRERSTSSFGKLN